MIFPPSLASLGTRRDLEVLPRSLLRQCAGCGGAAELPEMARARGLPPGLALLSENSVSVRSASKVVL